MANGYVEILSVLESKILSLAKDQYNKGFHGGTFTPGYIRKETGQSYPAINTALDSLVNYGILEKSKSTAFSHGEQIDIDVFKITEKGFGAIERIRSGAIKVEEREPRIEPQRSNESGQGFISKGKPSYIPEFSQSIKSMENNLATISEKVSELHNKLDKLLDSSTKSETQQSSEPSKARKPRATSQKSLKHQMLILGALKALSEKSKFVLANDVQENYIQKCKDLGISPKGAAQFKNILKRLEKGNLISLKTVGCKSLGIEGRGSRVVVELTSGDRNI